MNANRASYRRILLGAIPVLLLLLGYWWLAAQRHELNPNDRLTPLPSQLLDGLKWALTPGAAGADDGVPFVRDTFASMGRLILSLVIAGCVSFVLALLMHVLTSVRDSLNPLIVIMAKVPPVALLPILLLWLGVNERSKIVLLLFGVAPYLCLNLLQELKNNQREFNDKLSSMRMPLWQRVAYVEAPLIWPSFLHHLQTSLGPAWLFLLVAESIGAKHGLGYRIFVVRRYLAMDIILVYVVWIALLSVIMYNVLDWQIRRARWAA